MIRFKHRWFVRVAVTLLVCASTVVAAADKQQNVDAVSNDGAIDRDEIQRVLAISDDRAYGEYLSGECASCHSINAVEDSNVPVIHGAEATHLVRALLEFRAGLRSNTTMGLVAAALSDEEIAVLVHYLSSPDP